MNPLNNEINLIHDFDFHGFSRYGGGAFAGIMPYDRCCVKRALNQYV